MELIIGDKNLSTWSMRPWLALEHAGTPFTETRVRLRQTRSHDQIVAAGSPSGLVPVLKDGDLTVCDSLAIIPGRDVSGEPALAGRKDRPDPGAGGGGGDALGIPFAAGRVSDGYRP
jgi:Glutathione S-transferase, N-terminal domain